MHIVRNISFLPTESGPRSRAPELVETAASTFTKALWMLGVYTKVFITGLTS